jgi:hypothetical protein
MGIYAPFVYIVITISLIALCRNNTQMITPSQAVQQMNSDAGYFLGYRSAVLAYMAANPTFTGSIPLASLATYSPMQFSLLPGAGNYVSATGTAARLVTCWANVSTGSVQQAVMLAGDDASIGTSNGTTWTTAAPDVTQTQQPLNTPVKAGAIVSVIQIGT